MKPAEFVIVGSSGGGGTIAWVLANAGFEVVILEQGADPLGAEVLQSNNRYEAAVHDESRFRLRRPDFKRRLRGDYNTFNDGTDIKPFGEGWTGTLLGGGSVIWGTWSLRPLPIDFKLRTHFAATGQLKQLEQDEHYSIPDWPV